MWFYNKSQSKSLFYVSGIIDEAQNQFQFIS